MTLDEVSKALTEKDIRHERKTENGRDVIYIHHKNCGHPEGKDPNDHCWDYQVMVFDGKIYVNHRGGCKIADMDTILSDIEL